jgi:hypothetical protein
MNIKQKRKIKSNTKTPCNIIITYTPDPLAGSALSAAQWIQDWNWVVFQKEEPVQFE